MCEFGTICEVVWGWEIFCVEDGVWDEFLGDGLPVLIFGRVVWVELISGYDNIVLIL